MRTASLQEGRHRPCHYRAQVPLAWLEALFVLAQVAIEVSIEELVERRALGVAGPVDGRRLGHPAGAVVKSVGEKGKCCVAVQETRLPKFPSLDFLNRVAAAIGLQLTVGFRAGKAA